MSRSRLVHRLVSLIRSKNAATFYLNGPPGSGKSHLLGQLKEQLPTEIPRSLVLGPYTMTDLTTRDLGERIARDCQDAGFLDSLPPTSLDLDLVSVWRWIGENAHMPRGQSFLILVDLAQKNPDLAVVGTLFSGARYLEGVWTNPDIRVFHMFAGYWDHPALERHFQTMNISFPYTVGHNYEVWDGLSMEEMVEMACQFYPKEARPLHGRILFELTGGHPAAARDILEQIPPADLGFPTLLSSAHMAALSGPAGQALLEAWRQLPDESRSAMKGLALQRRMPVIAFPAHLERLRISGVVRLDEVGVARYLSFRSWYVELLIWLHAEALGIADEQIQRIRISELMPRTSELNVEAYRLINDIENQARNFAVVQLCLHSEPGTPILQGKAKKYLEREQLFEDAHQRASDWQTRSLNKGLPVGLNPLLAYLSTRDLATIIEEIGSAIGSEAWRRIAKAIRELSDVRDAVMHNQFIDDAALRRLYDLQADVYAALSRVT